MADDRSLVEEYVRRHRARLAELDSLVAIPPRDISDDDVVIAPEGLERPDAIGILRTRQRTPDDLRSPWHALTEYRLAFMFGTDVDESMRTARAADEILHLTNDHLAKIATPGNDEESLVITTAARDESLTDVLTRHHLAPTTIIALRRVSAAERINPSYPIGLPAGVRIVSADEVDRDELLGLAVRATTTEALQKRSRRREGVEDVLKEALENQIERGMGLTSVAMRDSRIIGFSIAGPLDEQEAARMDTPVRPMARGRLLWLEPSERGNGIAHSLMKYTHGKIADAGIPWSVAIYPAGVPMSGYFWAREGYRPLSLQWHRSPAVSR